MPERKNQEVVPHEGTGSCLARLCWMVIGNVILLVCAVSILGHHSSFFSVADLIFWATIALLIGVRYLDIKRLKGLTAAGEPASMAHWRRYVGILLAVCAAAWGAAHAAAYLQ